MFEVTSVRMDDNLKDNANDNGMETTKTENVYAPTHKVWSQ